MSNQRSEINRERKERSGVAIGSKTVNIVDMRQGNSIQLSVLLLGCILIARGAKQKQKRRYLEFENSVFPPLGWQLFAASSCSRSPEVQVRPRLPLKAESLAH